MKTRLLLTRGRVCKRRSESNSRFRFTDPDARPADSLAVLGGLLLGVTIGEALRLNDRLEARGGWFQQRFPREDRPSRIAEAFVTSSIVFWSAR